MPYFFLKQRDTDNKFDNTDIKFTVNTASSDELVREFYNFMLACGFHKDSALSGMATVLDENDALELD